MCKKRKTNISISITVLCVKKVKKYSNGTDTLVNAASLMLALGGGVAVKMPPPRTFLISWDLVPLMVKG